MQQQSNNPDLKIHPAAAVPVLTEHHLLYVSCLPKKVTKEVLFSYFKQFGEISYVEIDMIKGLPAAKGFALINFCENSAIEKVIARAEDHYINKKHIHVQSVSSKKDIFHYIDKMRNCRIYIRRMPPELNNEQLAELFAPFGKVKKAYKLQQPKSKKSRVLGYVIFEEIGALPRLKGRRILFRGEEVEWSSYYTNKKRKEEPACSDPGNYTTDFMYVVGGMPLKSKPSLNRSSSVGGSGHHHHNTRSLSRSRIEEKRRRIKSKKQKNLKRLKSGSSNGLEGSEDSNSTTWREIKLKEHFHLEEQHPHQVKEKCGRKKKRKSGHISKVNFYSPGDRKYHVTCRHFDHKASNLRIGKNGYRRSVRDRRLKARQEMLAKRRLETECVFPEQGRCVASETRPQYQYQQRAFEVRQRQMGRLIFKKKTTANIYQLF